MALSYISILQHAQVLCIERGTKFTEGGHYSLANNVLGGQNSLVDNVRGDMSRGGRPTL